MSLPIVLLAIAVASSASPIPTDIGEDYSDFGFPSHPDDSLVIYRVPEGDIVEAEELRHLEKRSPLVPFPFPLAKKPLKKKPKKVFLKPKLLKKSPFIKKAAIKGKFGFKKAKLGPKKALKFIPKKVLKKTVITSPKIKKFAPKIKAGSALSSLPALGAGSLPSLGAVSLVGGGAGAGGGGLAAVFGPPAAASLSRNFG